MKRIIYILFLFSLPLIYFGGNNDKGKVQLKNVSGRILSDNGNEIAGAKITIKETNETFFADLSGDFRFQIKNDKPYTILIESIGYSPLEIKSANLHLFSEVQLKEL